MNAGPRKLLALETSCDETAAAVVTEAGQVLSNVVSSQVDLHARFGGVVPEVASRAHVTSLIPVIEQSLLDSGISLRELSAIAVVTHPGLVGSLLVGLTAAKSLAWSLGLPLIAVNHIEAHLYACRMLAGKEIFPATGLVVSGGHTNLYDCESCTDLELLGSTIDDAAGEAFDKVAALLGLGYPGGPQIQKVAERGRADAYRFPRSFLKEERLEFSFSGLKTAVRYLLPKLEAPHLPDICASFQEAVVDVLVTKTVRAVKLTGRRIVAVSGGVSCNTRLREKFRGACAARGLELLLAEPALCTDNAAMIGYVAALKLAQGERSPLTSDIDPNLRLAPAAA